MKYIMFEHEIEGQKQLIPIIFPEQLVHELVARYMNVCFVRHGFQTKPVSAGFISVFGTKLTCSGNSETLKLESKSSDAAVIHNYDYTCGTELPGLDAVISRLVKK
jgi:hypothetical protein